MSYNDCESALATIIQSATGFSSANVSQGDYSVLGKGNNQAVVLMPGSVPGRQTSALPLTKNTTWDIEVELYISFTTDISTINTAIRTTRETLMDTIDAYPTLDGVVRVNSHGVIQARDPEHWVGESRNWWRQIMVVRVNERITLTNLEA